MDALVALFSILFTFWPLITLFGFQALADKELSFREGLRLGLRRVFLAWLICALLLGLITLSGRRPVSLLPERINTLAFLVFGWVVGSITIIWALSRYSRRRIRLADAEKLEDLMAMEPDAFEHLVAHIFRAYGYRAQLAGGNFDHGVDIVIHNGEGEKWIAQCKRYKGSVGEPIIRDLFGTMLHERARRAYLMTTGPITQQARDWARGKPIILYDGESLVKLIRRTQRNRSEVNRRKPTLR
jgi:HJR/Mrr/RecB family endonuclease